LQEKDDFNASPDLKNSYYPEKEKDLQDGELKMQGINQLAFLQQQDLLRA